MDEEHFVKVVDDHGFADVLFITGVTDKAPVLVFSHLVPDIKVIDVYIKPGDEAAIKLYEKLQAQQVRAGGYNDDNKANNNSTAADCCPSLVLEGRITTADEIKHFAEHHLLPFFHEDLRRLTDMVRCMFTLHRRQPEMLPLCAALMQHNFNREWSKIDKIVSFEEASEYAKKLAWRVRKQFALIRKPANRAFPTFSVLEPGAQRSYSGVKEMQAKYSLIPAHGSVVVVGLSLTTGETICTMLELLVRDGIQKQNISVIVEYELPLEGGRELLRSRGFGSVNVVSLVVAGNPGEL